MEKRQPAEGAEPGSVVSHIEHKEAPREKKEGMTFSSLLSAVPKTLRRSVSAKEKKAPKDERTTSDADKSRSFAAAPLSSSSPATAGFAGDDDRGVLTEVSSREEKKKKRKKKHRSTRTEPTYSDEEDDDFARGLERSGEVRRSKSKRSSKPSRSRSYNAESGHDAATGDSESAIPHFSPAAVAVDTARTSPEASEVARDAATESKHVPSGADSKEEFHRDVRRAFQVVAAQLVALMFLYVLWVVYDMLDEVLTPLFWALLFSIVLREPKRLLLERLEPLERIEKRNRDSGYFAIAWAKLVAMTRVFAAPFGGALAVGLLMHVSWRVLGVPSFPFLAATIAVVVLLSLAFAWLAVTESKDYEGLASSLVVFGALGFTLFFVIFFVFQAVVESSEFFFDVKEMVQVAIADPVWGEKLLEYGITQDVIDENIGKAYVFADEWITSQGYNLTEIQEVISSFTETSGNSTEVAVASPLDALSSFDLTELDLGTVYEQISEVDLGLFSEISSYVTEYVLGAGMSIVSYLGEAASYIMSALSSALDIFVFVGALLFFVQEDEMVDTVFDLIPVSRSHQKEVAVNLQKALSEVFMVSILICVAHGAATWLFFTFAGMPFPYSAAFLTGVIAIFPLLSEWLIFLPSLGIVYLKGSSYTLYYAVGLYIVQFLLGMVDDAIFDLIPDSHAYITALALVLGVSSFGLQGVLIGPMLIVIVKLLYRLFSSHLEEPLELATGEEGGGKEVTMLTPVETAS